MSVKYPYFCSHCSHKIPSAEKILVIENSIARPFCSESCIVEYHSRYVEYFEEDANNLREELGIEKSDQYDFVFDDPKVIESLLSRYDEKWLDVSDMGEHYYIHLKKLHLQGQLIHLIALVLYFQDSPSMILYHGATVFEDFVQKFRRGKLITPNKKNEVEDIHLAKDLSTGDEIDLELPEELFQSVEKKKSEYLAQMLSLRGDDDIPFEDFVEYESYIEQSLSQPDEVYELVDDEDDFIVTYVRSFVEKKKSFFYVVVCMKIQSQQTQEIMLPIITFPSMDPSLYQKYKLGERVSSMMKS